LTLSLTVAGCTQLKISYCIPAISLLAALNSRLDANSFAYSVEMNPTTAEVRKPS